tara:strand:+ start:971 stop:1363 length:393 start_codon:yes stop_codon:yes gene_type:complete
MTKQVSTWMTNASDIEHLEKRAKNPPFLQSVFRGGSIEQIALESFTAKKKLEKQRYELKQLINMQYGPQGWAELIKIESSVRKQRAELIYKKKELMDKIFNVIGIIVLSSAILAFFVLLLWLWKQERGFN